MTGLVERIKMERIDRSWGAIESWAQRNSLLGELMENIAGSVKGAQLRNMRSSLIEFKKILIQSRKGWGIGGADTTDMSSCLEACFILHKLVESRSIKEKIIFFATGKALYELHMSIQSKAKPAAPAGGSRLVKSNSLIVTSTNNLFFGFQAVEALINRNIGFALR